jgi:hypothetical protein
MAEKKNVGYSPEDFIKSHGEHYNELIVELAAKLQYALINTPFPAVALLRFDKFRYKSYHSPLF